MTSLVTGASGFIGSYLVERLLELGHQVRCLVLESESLGRLQELPVEIVYGDICKRETLDGIAHGADYVFHLAAVKIAWNQDTYFRINYQGTKNLLDSILSQNSGLKRFIYMSSLAAAGPSPHGQPIKEDHPCLPVSNYGRSKLAAELYVLMHGSKLPITILRPPPVYGANSVGPSLIGLLVRLSKWRVLPNLNHRGRINYIHVSDLIQALILTAENDNGCGQVYFLTEPAGHSWREIGEMMFALRNLKGLVIPIPRVIVKSLAKLAISFQKLRRKPYGFIDELVDQLMQQYWLCSSEKAKQDLGFVAATPLEDGLRTVLEWYDSRLPETRLIAKRSIVTKDN